MSYLYPMAMGSYPQQTQFMSGLTRNQMWLLQQPKDSGYASDEYDLFEKAFGTELPSMTEVSDDTESCSLNVEVGEMSTSNFSDSSPSEASSSSPFQYADPVYAYKEQLKACESLNMSVKKLSIDAGISSMTGYCDIDSLLTAAYYDTCITQNGRFQSFSSQHSARPSVCMDSKTPIPQRKVNFEEPESPETSFKARGKMPHTAVEQRYRQNLNDQFSRLRQSVPEIQTSQPGRSGQPPKPSKAEVLSAASEYIRQLEEENQQLRETMVGQALDMRRKRAKTG